MKDDKGKTSNLVQQCPACGGRFTVNSASRKRKVQCPQCREIVVSTDPTQADLLPENPAPATPPPPSAPVAPTIPEWVARCEMLQARIEALEHQIESLMESPRPHAALIPERLPERRPSHSPEPMTPPASRPVPVAPPEEPAPEPREIVRHTPIPPPLSESPRESFGREASLPPLAIGLLVAEPGDAARRLADSLSEILSRTGWKVRTLPLAQANGKSPEGLTLAAAPTLPLQRVTTTLNALRAGGYSVAFQLDPGLGASEAMLTIGSAENEPMQKN